MLKILRTFVCLEIHVEEAALAAQSSGALWERYGICSRETHVCRTFVFRQLRAAMRFVKMTETRKNFQEGQL